MIIHSWGSRTSFSLSISQMVLSFVTLSSFVAVCCPDTLAQNVAARPIARLITNSQYSRPRRVTALAHSKAATAIGASSSLSAANIIERRAFEKTNAARVQNGLPPFEWDADLFRMARINSENMARQGYFSHVTPEGLVLRDRAHAAGIQHFSLLGENIAYNQGYDDPGAFAVEKWMTSPGHRANILYAGFQASAIGTYVAPDGSVFLTQVFMTR